MADEKVVKILLSMGLSKDGINKTVEEMRKLQAQMTALEVEAKRLRKEMDTAVSQNKNTDDLVINLALVEQGLEKVRRKAQQTFQEGFGEGSQIAAFNLRDIGEKLTQLGSRATQAGFGILGPIQNAANLYLESVNAADPIANRWRDAMSDVEDSWLRIGAVAADELLPLIETLADTTDKLADFVEANPELIKIAVGAGAGLIGLGGALQAGGNLAMIVGTLQGLSKIPALAGLGGNIANGASKIQQSALGGWLGSSVIPGAAQSMGQTSAARLAMATGATAPSLFGIPVTAAGGVTGASLAAAASPLAILGGMFAGGSIYDNLIATQGSGRAKSGEILGQGASLLGYGAGSLTDAFGLTKGAADDWFKVMGEMTGVIETQTQAAEKKTRIDQEQLSAFAAWTDAAKARTNFEKQSGEERSRIVAEQAAERTRIEQTYGQQRAESIAAFLRSESRTEEDYYLQRSQVASKYGKEVERMEEDHQRAMRRMLEDHNSRVTDLTASRDALGLKKEQKSYETNRRRAEEDYNVQARRRSEDFAAQVAQMESAFALQRERRQEDFDLRLEQMDAQHAEQMKKYDEQNKAVLDKLDERNKKELQQLTENESTRARVLSDVFNKGLSEAQSLSIQTSEKYLGDFKKWIEQQKSSYGQLGGKIGPPAPSTTTGGYDSSSAEMLMGRRLTQQDNMAGSGRNATIINQITHPGGSITEMKRYVAESMVALKGQILTDLDKQMEWQA